MYDSNFWKCEGEGGREGAISCDGVLLARSVPEDNDLITYCDNRCEPPSINIVR